MHVQQDRCLSTDSDARFSPSPQPTLVDDAGSPVPAGLLPESGAKRCCRSCRARSTAGRQGSVLQQCFQTAAGSASMSTLSQVVLATPPQQSGAPTLRISSMLLGAEMSGCASAVAGAGTARGRAAPPPAARLAAGCFCRAPCSPSSCPDCSSESLPRRRLRTETSFAGRPGPCASEAAMQSRGLGRRQAGDLNSTQAYTTEGHRMFKKRLQVGLRSRRRQPAAHLGSGRLQRHVCTQHIMQRRDGKAQGAASAPPRRPPAVRVGLALRPLACLQHDGAGGSPGSMRLWKSQLRIRLSSSTKWYKQGKATPPRLGFRRGRNSALLPHAHAPAAWCPTARCGLPKLGPACPPALPGCRPVLQPQRGRCEAQQPAPLGQTSAPPWTAAAALAAVAAEALALLLPRPSGLQVVAALQWELA